MERRFYTDNFERMLKEKADEFRMYPSAKVWHSIYNNVHPGRKWPSMAMTMVLIGLLLLVGYTNSNVAKESPAVATSTATIAISKLPFISVDNINNKNIATADAPTENALLMLSKMPRTNRLSSPSVLTNSENHLHSSNQATLKRNKKTDTISHESETVDQTNPTGVTEIENTRPAIASLINEGKVLNEKILIENKSINKKNSRKFGWQVYATPSVVYRSLSENYIDNSVSTADINNSINQKPSIGLEVGASMQYSLLKRLKLKTGLQLNYTSYNAEAYQSSHPNSASLTLNDFNSNQIYQVDRSTDLGNNNGLYPVKLRNETYQVSLPVGLELKILGKDNLHWDIGATIQPTYIIGGNGYLLSTDRRSYIKESSMLNNWNLNAGFETFITYKLNGLTWQLGPQFRYQVMSTYSKNFTINENLANYGVKLGVSKVLK